MREPIEQLRFLNSRIVLRHEELARAVGALSESSARLERRSRTLRVATIILGAFTASQGAVIAALGTANAPISLVFAACGMAVAAIGGVEAAFNLQGRAAELRMLAAKCQSARFQHNSEWSYRIAIAEPEEGVDAARDLLAVQDRTLSEVQVGAAKLGLDIAFLTPEDAAETEADENAAFLLSHEVSHHAIEHDDVMRGDEELPAPDAVKSPERGWSDEG